MLGGPASPALRLSDGKIPAAHEGASGPRAGQSPPRRAAASL